MKYCALAALLSLTATGAAQGAVGRFTIGATVPLRCEAQLVRTQAPISEGEGAVLGQLSEYCNAPRGYQLVVRYTPGSLAGTVLRIGEDSVVLNGSGLSVLSQSTTPRIRSRTISAVPGGIGLQTQQLELFMIPAA